MDGTKEEDSLFNKMENDEANEQPTFETLLETLGEFGKFQRIVFSLLTLSDLMNAMVLMYLIFSTVVPKWTCLEFEGFNMTDVADKDLSGKHYRNVSIANVGNETNAFENVCEFNGSKCIRYSFADGYRSIVVEWELVCEKKYIAHLTTSITMFGLTLGVGLAAQVSDLIGRKKVVSFVMIMMLVCQTLVGFSVNWQMFAALRFFTGMFVASSMTLSFLIPMEFISPKWRSLCGGLGIFNLGTAIMALVAYLLQDWRHHAFVSGTLFIPLAIAIVIYVPESIRWQIQKQRFHDAAAGIRRMARVNRKPVPDLALMERISQSQKQQSRAEARYTYIDLFRTRKLVVTTLTLMFTWFSMSIIYYGLVTSISSMSGNIYLNTVYSSLPGLFLGWTVIPVANWLGRKGAFLLYGTFPILAMFGIVILQATGQTEEQAMARTVLAIIGKVTAGEMWTVALIITSEQYPTLMRTIGIGLSNLTGRIAGILAPQVWFLGDITHWTVPYVIYGCLALTTVILVIVLIPETRGRPMPEDLPPRSGFCSNFSSNGGGDEVKEVLSTEGHVQSTC